MIFVSVQTIRRKEAEMATSRKSSNGKSTKSTSSGRKKPGSGGQGDYYHVEVRQGGDFEAFRTQDVGDAGHLHLEREKRKSCSCTTVKWMLSKEEAKTENSLNVGDLKDAKHLIKN